MPHAVIAKSSIACLAGIAASLAFALPAGAASDEECIPYAAAAVSAAVSAAANRCGFTGTRWSDRHTDHMTWCQAADPTALAAEADARDERLRGCIAARSAAGDSPERERCTSYAAAAVDHQRDNLTRQCGFSGEAWDTNWQEHFAWCIAAPAADADARNAERIGQLAEACVQRVCTKRREVTIRPPFVRTIEECRTVPRQAP